LKEKSRKKNRRIDVKNIAFILQYDGSRYSGWQRQGNTRNTIEYKVTHGLEMLLPAPPDSLELHGSGRTDAGVHAMGQVANVHLDTELSPEALMAGLNRVLPEDIRVVQAEEKPERFHSRLSAVSKTYRYRIDTTAYGNVFLRKYSWHYPKQLDIQLMEQCAVVLLGKQDFRSFTDLKNKKKSTIRCISAIDIQEEQGMISISYTGDGFLYHMARLMTTALVLAGEGKLSCFDLQNMLDRKEKPKELFLAPAQGLTLMEVNYK
jgi:tRNA pseudouridine38-40 synthase